MGRDLAAAAPDRGGVHTPGDALDREPDRRQAGTQLVERGDVARGDPGQHDEVVAFPQSICVGGRHSVAAAQPLAPRPRVADGDGGGERRGLAEPERQIPERPFARPRFAAHGLQGWSGGRRLRGGIQY